MNDIVILLKVAELERRLIEAQQRSDDAQRQASINLIKISKLVQKFASLWNTP